MRGSLVKSVFLCINSGRRSKRAFEFDIKDASNFPNSSPIIKMIMENQQTRQKDEMWTAMLYALVIMLIYLIICFLMLSVK